MAIIIGDGTANLLIGTPAPDTIRAGGLLRPVGQRLDPVQVPATS